MLHRLLRQSLWSNFTIKNSVSLDLVLQTKITQVITQTGITASKFFLISILDLAYKRIDVADSSISQKRFGGILSSDLDISDSTQTQLNFILTNYMSGNF